MKPLKLGLAIAALGIATGTAYAAGTDRAAIEALEKNKAAAIQAKNVDGIMANYLPGNDLIVFDVIPPRQYAGFDAYKKNWTGFVGGCADTPKLEVSDMQIEGTSSLAFSHSIQHFVCTDPKGQKQDVTLRATDVYRKVKGKWLIVHEHYSVPVDLATGKPDTDSKP